MFENGRIFYWWLRSSAAAASWLQWHQGSAAASTGTSGESLQSPAPSWGPGLRASSEVHQHSKSSASRETKEEQTSASVQPPSTHLWRFCCPADGHNASSSRRRGNSSAPDCCSQLDWHEPQDSGLPLLILQAHYVLCLVTECINPVKCDPHSLVFLTLHFAGLEQKCT